MTIAAGDRLFHITPRRAGANQWVVYLEKGGRIEYLYFGVVAPGDPYVLNKPTSAGTSVAMMGGGVALAAGFVGLLWYRRRQEAADDYAGAQYRRDMVNENGPGDLR
jgi:hypothetical protein